MAPVGKSWSCRAAALRDPGSPRLGPRGLRKRSVGRIAEEAGFSKGAFYSSFASKEEIVLELLETHSLQDVVVEEIAVALHGVTTPAGVIDVVSE